MKLLYIVPVLLGLYACSDEPLYVERGLLCHDDENTLTDIKIYKNYASLSVDGKVIKLKDMENLNNVWTNFLYNGNKLEAYRLKNKIGFVLNNHACFSKEEKISELNNIQPTFDNYKDYGLGELLYDASDYGNQHYVRRLTELGANVNHTCSIKCTDWTPVMIATANNHYNVVEYLLENGANPNAQNRYGRTAIAFAVNYKIKDITKLLLDYGADPTIESQDTDKPNSGLAGALATSVSDTNSYEILKILVYKTEKVNFEFWDYTPLMMAVRYDDYDFAKYLLDNGADVNHKKSIKQEDGSIIEYTIKGLAESKEMQDLIDSYTVSENDSGIKEDN